LSTFSFAVALLTHVAALKSQHPLKRKADDEAVLGDKSEKHNEKKVAPTSDRFQFASIRAASQDIRQLKGTQSNMNASIQNDVSIIQQIVTLIISNHNTLEASFGGHKASEDIAVPLSLETTTSSFSQEQQLQEEILSRLSSSGSDPSCFVEMLQSQQEQTKAVSRPLNSQQQLQNLVQRNEQGHIVSQLMPFLAQQRKHLQGQESISENHSYASAQALLQLLYQFATTGVQDPVSRGLPNNQVAQLPSFAGCNSDPIQNSIASSSQTHSKGVDPQPLLLALLNALAATASSPKNQDAESGTSPLATANDSDCKLSDYQVLLRQQLEFFVAQRSDVDSSTQGRRKQVRLGQVGLRCRHCAHLPLKSRERGAVYYPAKLENVYQAAQNMVTIFLARLSHVSD
jgi:hypothetical protein